MRFPSNFASTKFWGTPPKKMIACNPEQVESVAKSVQDVINYAMMALVTSNGGDDSGAAIGNPYHKVCLGCNRES